MSLKFRDEAERQEVVRLHAELYQRARAGEITTREMLRLSRALLEEHQKKPEREQDGTIEAQKEQE